MSSELLNGNATIFRFLPKSHTVLKLGETGATSHHGQRELLNSQLKARKTHSRREKAAQFLVLLKDRPFGEAAIVIMHEDV